MWHLLAHWLGLDNGAGAFYLAWSGFVSDLTELALFLGIFGAVRKINCHAKRCWRIGHFAVEGTPYKVCRIHHPRVPDKGATVEHIHELYWRHQKEKNGIQSEVA